MKLNLAMAKFSSKITGILYIISLMSLYVYTCTMVISKEKYVLVLRHKYIQCMYIYIIGDENTGNKNYHTSPTKEVKYQ